MAEYRVLKRVTLLLGAAVGWLLCGLGLIISAGAAMEGAEPVFALSEEVSLPCRVEGTGLIARQLVMYEGPYLENGGDDPVSDITALVLYNDSEWEITQAEVVLTAQEELAFLASNIMPGTQVLVLEKNGSAWKDWQVSRCTGWISQVSGEFLPDAALTVKEVDMGALQVTNTSGKELRDIWLYYKNYLPEADLYIGGITYITMVEHLAPGQSMVVCPGHYAAGYSRILKAECVP